MTKAFFYSAKLVCFTGKSILALWRKCCALICDRSTLLPSDMTPQGTAEAFCFFSLPVENYEMCVRVCVELAGSCHVKSTCLFIGFDLELLPLSVNRSEHFYVHPAGFNT